MSLSKMAYFDSPPLDPENSPISISPSSLESTPNSTTHLQAQHHYQTQNQNQTQNEITIPIEPLYEEKVKYKTPLTLEEWLDLMKDKYLKISDISNLKTGESIKLLCIDRNFYDCIDMSGKIKLPEDFFKSNYIIKYIQNNGLHGKANFNCDDENEWNNFNFHINYAPECWYPLNNKGLLPKKDPQGFSIFTDNTIRDWREYPIDTLIGWRGEMLKWDDVITAPPLYYNEEVYEMTIADKFCCCYKSTKQI